MENSRVAEYIKDKESKDVQRLLEFPGTGFLAYLAVAECIAVREEVNSQNIQNITGLDLSKELSNLIKNKIIMPDNNKVMIDDTAYTIRELPKEERYQFIDTLLEMYKEDAVWISIHTLIGAGLLEFGEAEEE